TDTGKTLKPWPVLVDHYSFYTSGVDNSRQKLIGRHREFIVKDDYLLRHIVVLLLLCLLKSHPESLLKPPTIGRLTGNRRHTERLED
ncbi:hypothetical protein H922_13254, partial [Citrobacter freundii GTC 09629]|uniref:hypothetical protein n=1 Tax=Citrobacter freundii TaxID=546 RepID=UPI00032F1446